MSKDVEFKLNEEFKNKLIKEYMDNFLQSKNLKPEDVVLVQEKTIQNNKEIICYYFAEKTDAKL